MADAPNLLDVEDAVLDLRCDIVVIEALLSDVLPQSDAGADIGAPRLPHHTLALVPDDARRAFHRALDTLRVNIGRVSVAAGFGAIE